MKSRALTFSTIFFFIHISASAGIWTSYTNSDAVRQIVIRDERIWGATSGGVIAYTPASGAIIKLTNTDGLGGIDFRCAVPDTSGNLWFGTSDGWLSSISPSGAIRNFAFRDSVGLVGSAVSLNALFPEDERLWVGSDIGVSKFLIYSNGGEIKDTARKLGNLSDQEDVVCVAVIGGFLWAGTARGIAFIDKDNQNIQYYGFWRSFQQGDDGLTNADIRTIVSYRDTVVIGTHDGIFKFVTSPDTVWAQMGLSGVIISRLFAEDTMLLAATSGGIYQYGSSGWTSFPSTGLPQRLASDLARDAGGGFWAGTPASGIAGLADTLWVLHSIPGPSSNVITDIVVDHAGGAWMTHDSKGLSKFYQGEWTIYNSRNSDPDGPGPLLGLQDDYETSMAVAPDGNVWVGSWGGGLYEYNWTSWLHWDATNSPMFGVPVNHDYWAASAVTVDDSGDVWVSSLEADSGLLMGVLNPAPGDSMWARFFIGTGRPPDNVIWNLRAQGNYVWIGRGVGLDRLDFNGTPFNESDDTWRVAISGEYIADMDVDPFGVLWFGATSGVFYVFADADSAYKVEVPPEISGSVNTVASDGVGNIWVGTVSGMGVLRPDRSTWSDIYTTANSPLLNNKVNDIAVEISTGRIFIGTEGGLSILDSGILPPSPDLSDVEAYPNPVILSEGQNSVHFKRAPADATVTIYTFSGEMVVQFKLSDPGRESWDLRNSEHERVAGGIYIFHVKSGEASGTGKLAIIK